MLSGLALKNLQLDCKPYKRSDGGGLFVIVQPNGRDIGVFQQIGGESAGQQFRIRRTWIVRNSTPWMAAPYAGVLMRGMAADIFAGAG